MSGLRIGFIGAGNMAQALAKGFVSAELLKPNMMKVSCPVSDKHLLKSFKAMGCQTTHSNLEVAESSDLVILAVKPNVMNYALEDIYPAVSPVSPLVTSIALGVTLRQMQDSLKPNSRIIRIMPNTPALVNLGASVFTKGDAANEEDAHNISRLFSSVGRIDEVPEYYLDAITGLSGAGPAYMYVILEALADGGVKMGLPRDLSIRLAAQTMMGSAKMVLDTAKSPGQLKDEVCSPGGCTIQGVAALENGGIRASLINAVEDATLKSLEIAEK